MTLGHATKRQVERTGEHLINRKVPLLAAWTRSETIRKPDLRPDEASLKPDRAQMAAVDHTTGCGHVYSAQLDLPRILPVVRRRDAETTAPGQMKLCSCATSRRLRTKRETASLTCHCQE